MHRAGLKTTKITSAARVPAETVDVEAVDAATEISSLGHTDAWTEFKYFLL